MNKITDDTVRRMKTLNLNEPSVQRLLAGYLTSPVNHHLNMKDPQVVLTCVEKFVMAVRSPELELTASLLNQSNSS